jgi:hypothetical protein
MLFPMQRMEITETTEAASPPTHVETGRWIYSPNDPRFSNPTPFVVGQDPDRLIPEPT